MPDGETFTTEEVEMPEREAMAFRLAAMTLDRDRQALAAAEMRVKLSEQAAKEAEAALVEKITDGGRYVVAQERVAIDADKVKRRLA